MLFKSSGNLIALRPSFHHLLRSSFPYEYYLDIRLYICHIAYFNYTCVCVLVCVSTSICVHIYIYIYIYIYILWIDYTGKAVCFKL